MNEQEEVVVCCVLPLGLQHLPGTTEENSEDGGYTRLNFGLGTFHKLLPLLHEHEDK